jgi:DNA repair protein RecO (recombination protein O)
MMHSYKIEGIVLSRLSMGEADRSLVVFTREFGKRRFLARGIRKTTSKRASYLEPFCHFQAVIHPGHSREIMAEVSSIQTFPLLRTRLERLSLAYVALELVDRLTAENQELWPVFHQLKEILAFFNNTQIDRRQAAEKLEQFKHFLLFELGFTSNEQAATLDVDRTIEEVLEAKLKSVTLLTRVQSGGYNLAKH